ncbi:MAG TPA: glycosyltransferase family 39 protein, partial [Tepidisphaeraceae bacterium]
MDVSLEDNDSDGRERFLAPAWLLALWLLCGGLLFVGLGTAPIERTQEVRVLETAREMLGAGAQGWLIPKFNGVERLHKPPLNYWLTAICYKIFGVSAGVGRTPTALAAWATLGIVYACGRWLFGGRAGFFAAAALFGSFMFFKFMRLAETDALATVFVTLAIWAWWRAAEGRSRVGVPAHHGETPDEPAQDEPTVGGNAHPTMAQGHGAATVLEYRSARVPVADTAVRAAGTTHPWLWYHLGAVGVAGAVMSKGPPGIFPILFLLGYVVAARRKGALLQWLASGCWITALLLAAPWFWYVNHTVGLARIADEVEVVTTGRGHSNWFYIYFAYLVLDTAP